MDLSKNIQLNFEPISLEPNKKLGLTTLLSALTSLLFLIFFISLLVHGQSLQQHETLIATTGGLALISHLGTLGLSTYFFIFENSKNNELKERAKFAYLWTICLGFLFFATLILYYAYKLSSEDAKYLQQAKEEYENNVAYDLYEQAVKQQHSFDLSVKQELEFTLSLYQQNFITKVERNSYLQRLLKDNTKILDQIDYTSQEVIQQVHQIIHTLK